MKTHVLLRILCTTALVTLLVACAPSGGGNLQVTEQGKGPGKEDTETIHLNNCNGKADAVQIATRAQSVELEVGGNLGVGVEIVQAAVSAKYATNSYTSKSIQLTAPPGTDMVFRLKWSMAENVGIVSNVGPRGLAVTYHQFTPIDVQIVDQGDLGDCGTSGAQTQPGNGEITGPPAPVPTNPPPPTDTPVPPPTAIPDTPPGTVLQVGQHWRQGGFDLVVADTELGSGSFGGPGVFVHLKLTSLKSQDIAIRYDLSDAMSAFGNLGNRLNVANPYDWYKEPQTIEVIIHPGETVDLHCEQGWRPIVEVDATNPAITSVFVELSVYGISGARWEIPIPH